MSTAFSPAAYSPSTLGLLPGDRMIELDRCGQYGIYQSNNGPIALDDDDQEPADWSVGMTGPGWVPTILHCSDADGKKHILRHCMRYVVDYRTGETSCMPCWRDTLALGEGA